VAATCVGYLAPARGATQSDYTVPARELLFTGTLSGLADAYQILNNGMSDESVTGDKRELILLHVVARTGMLVFDRDDVAVNTSLLEIAQPFGVTVTGDTLFPEDPCDPDRVVVTWPINPADPNCVLIPPGANVEAAANAINAAILPEIESIVAELNQVSDSPAFAMTLTPAETGAPADIEVDYGDVLALKAVLLGAKALLYSLANPGYDLSIDLNNPIFSGWQCGILPESTTINTVLNAYQNLLEILPTTGPARLAQAKQNLIAALGAVNDALTHMESETDDQMNDLLYIEGDDHGYQSAKAEFNKLRTSLQDGVVQTYAAASMHTYTLSQSGEPIGQIVLKYGPAGIEDVGWLRLSDPGTLPEWWDIDWFDVREGRIEGEAEPYMWEGWYWGWFWGDISADGSQITNLTFEYWDWWSGDTISGLSAQRTDSDVTTVQFNPNPLFAGSVSLRDILPQLDANDMPIPGTMGHGLGDDATLGGVFPAMTQQDWIGSGYEVYGIADPNELMAQLSPWQAIAFYQHLDQQGDVVTKLGASAGGTATFSGAYPWYIVATRSRIRVDSIHGPENAYLGLGDEVVAMNLDVFAEDLWDVDFIDSGPVLGPPDSVSIPLGELGLFGRFTGFVAIANPGGWTGLTVVTTGEPARLLHDWNNDGIVSIIGDVPPFVECVYFSNCPAWPEEELLAVGDCNHDGFISIIGDVPCFVNCVYFGNCPQ